MGNKWITIQTEIEDMWYASAQYKHFPLTASKEEYELERDLFKARRIYDLYGYEYCARYIREHPDTRYAMDAFVPCKREPHLYQCTMFCHKYDFEKGCMLNATE